MQFIVMDFGGNGKTNQRYFEYFPHLDIRGNSICSVDMN